MSLLRKFGRLLLILLVCALILIGVLACVFGLAGMLYFAFFPIPGGPGISTEADRCFGIIGGMVIAFCGCALAVGVAGIWQEEGVSR